VIFERKRSGARNEARKSERLTVQESRWLARENLKTALLCGSVPQLQAVSTCRLKS